jgi:SAM-dependent methyltransferase
MTACTFEWDSYAACFDEFRTIPAPTMQLYLDMITRTVPSPKRALDLGAGSGQFTIALALAFPGITIEAAEPSSQMRAKLAQNVGRTNDANVVIRSESLTELPALPAFDLVVLSEVIHLLDPILLVQKLLSLTKTAGCVVIRTSSQEQLRRRDWYRFFPPARFVDILRHPPLELIEQMLRSNGFLVSQTIIDESRRVSAESFRHLLTRRMFSTLYLITDEEFEEGCARVESELRGTVEYNYDYEMTLLTARRL